MTEPRPPALAIAPENDTAHIGPPEILLPHVRAEAPTKAGERVIAWQFYDGKARPLHAADDGAGGAKLVVTDPEADPPSRDDQQLLVTRIGLALENAQLRLDARFGPEGPGPDDKVEVVQVAGELEDVLTMLSALEALKPAPPDVDPDPGNWLHNLLDAAFGRR